jgi:hypothetical protein
MAQDEKTRKLAVARKHQARTAKHLMGFGANSHSQTQRTMTDDDAQRMMENVARQIIASAE